VSRCHHCCCKHDHGRQDGPQCVLRGQVRDAADVVGQPVGAAQSDSTEMPLVSLAKLVCNKMQEWQHVRGAAN
jgi:hypothetical protein